jgi:hypothetical protein
MVKTMEEIKFTDRTFDEESEYCTAVLVDQILSGRQNLLKMIRINPCKYVSLIFISDNYKSKLLYYYERCPLTAPVKQATYDLLFNRKLFSSLIIFKEDFKQAKIWNIFNDFFCAYLLTPTQNISKHPPLHYLIGTHGHNLIRIQICNSVKYMRTVLRGYSHLCDNNALYQRLCLNGDFKYSEARNLKPKPQMRHLKTGFIYQCDVCGECHFYDKWSLSTLKRMIERYVQDNSKKG